MEFSCKLMLRFFLMVLLFSGAGCFRDPNLQKQRYFDSGTQYFQKGKYPEAIIEFQNAIQIDKNFAEAHYQLAQCYLRQSLWPNAYRELTLTLELEPKNRKARLDEANLLFEARQFQNARDHALSILQGEPAEVGAQLLLADCDAELGNKEEAVVEAEKGVRMAPDKPAPYLTLGLLQENVQRFSDAEQNLQKAVSIDPNLLSARLGLGSFYQRQNRWAEAETQYRAAIEVDKGSSIPRASLASLYLAWGKKDLAEQTLMEAKKALSNDSAGYQILGNFYLANGESEKALSEFASLHQEHPNDLVVKKRYIQLLIQNKQLDQASKLNEEILKKNSRDADSLIFKGQCLNQEQKSTEAIPVLETAVKSNPDDPVGHFELGISYAATGNFVGAEKEWREAVQLKPSMLDAQQALATLALRNGDIGLLEQCAAEWLKDSPSAPQGYLMRGMSRMKKGDAPGAESDLRRAIELDPRNAAAHAQLGDLRLLQKRFADAEKLYEQALEDDPQSSEALQGLANLFLAQKQPEKALRRVQEQIHKVPDNSGFYLLLGETMLGNRKPAEAQTSLQKAVELDKNNLNAFLLLAQVQEATGQLNAAETTYESSIRENPRDVRSYVRFGELEERQGNWQKAQQLYEKALQIHVDQPDAANNLSYLLLEHGGDANYALSLAQIARRGMPDSANTADTLAWAYYKKGIYGSAIELLREAIKKVPQNSTYYYHLGLAYQKTDNPELARANFQHALQIDPKSPRAEEIRRALTDLTAR
jgi:tetratricopeptide (TPR) repeat protein